MHTIVFYNHTGLVSGAERMLLLILQRIDRRLFAPVVISPSNGTLRAECEPSRTPWQEAPQLSARFTFNPITCAQYCVNVIRAAFALRRTFLEKQPALIHANSIRAGIVATLSTAGTRIPVLWHLHDLLPVHPVSFAVRLLALCSLRTRVVGCSSATAKHFAGKLFSACSRRVFVARNGIETGGDRISHESKALARTTLGLSAHDFIIGIVGQIAPRKGHDSLIRAFAAFSQHCPQAQLLIVGTAIFNRDHEYAAKLQDLAQELNVGQRVHFLGSRKDVPRVMRALDLLVLNSKVEPFALVIMEAMLQGTPVLATDSGGPAEIIQHRVHGHLIPTANQPALESALLDLYRNPELRAQYEKAGPEHVRAYFSADGYIQTIQSIYQRILGPAVALGKAPAAHAETASAAASNRS